MTITVAREDFLSDIITTAIEGGIGYWSVCEQYQWVDSMEPDRRLRVSVGERRPERGTCALVTDTVDDQPRSYWITPEVIHNGIGRIVRGEVGVRADLKRWTADADAEQDAGMIDADGADVIVQAGLFGEVIYG